MSSSSIHTALSTDFQLFQMLLLIWQNSRNEFIAEFQVACLIADAQLYYASIIKYFIKDIFS
jgi:hypothetical protein